MPVDAPVLEALERGRTIEVDGVPTHVHNAGSGPPVLLVHGSGPGVSAWANWRPVLPRLAERHRVIAHDQLGFNRTAPPPDGRYEREAWTRHALGVLDALEVERCSVVGNSMGGSIALALARAAPERVERIVCMGSMGVAIPLPAGLDAVWGYELSRERMRHLIELFAYDDALATGDLVDLRYEASAQPGLQEAYAAMFPSPRQRWVDDLALPDQELADIGQPALLIHGWDDEVVPRETSLLLMEKLPNADLHLFGRCGHWVMIEHTRRFLTLVEAFLDG